jgi:hypothetical protein
MCGAATSSMWKSSQDTLPIASDASLKKAGKKANIR